VLVLPRSTVQALAASVMQASQRMHQPMVTTMASALTAAL
jgi:hypothetical protein